LSVAAATFPRSDRLLDAEAYQRVFKRCRCKSSDQFISVLAVPNDLGHPRLGLAISVKSSGNAVSRNRLKRLVRESFRLHRNGLGGKDIVVITRAGAAALDNRQFLSALAVHWKNLNKKCAD
jgi:ribonuclease P protein component